MLSVVQPFHRQRAIEGDALLEVHFQNRVMRTGGRRPESIRIAIQRKFLFCSGFDMLPAEIVAILGSNCLAELFQPLNICVGNQSAPVRSNAEHELPAAPYSLLVRREQLRQTLETCFIVGMPEPVILAQRGVGFNWTPAKISVTINYVPVLVRDDAIFVSDPANITVLKKRHVGEYQRVRLGYTKLLHDSREVVNVA